jgi:hypothetical protein
MTKKPKMKAVCVLLEPGQLADLQRLAETNEVTQAKLFREGVDLVVAKYRRLVRVAGHPDIPPREDPPSLPLFGDIE